MFSALSQLISGCFKPLDSLLFHQIPRSPPTCFGVQILGLPLICAPTGIGLRTMNHVLYPSRLLMELSSIQQALVLSPSLQSWMGHQPGEWCFIECCISLLLRAICCLFSIWQARRDSRWSFRKGWWSLKRMVQSFSRHPSGVDLLILMAISIAHQQLFLLHFSLSLSTCGIAVSPISTMFRSNVSCVRIHLYQWVPPGATLAQHVTYDWCHMMSVLSSYIIMHIYSHLYLSLNPQLQSLGIPTYPLSLYLILTSYSITSYSL